MFEKLGNRRSNSVLVYKDQKGKLYCRIGVGNDTPTSCGEICTIFRVLPHVCCSYGNHDHPETRDFHYDNTIHTIALSSNLCRLCDKQCSNTPELCQDNSIILMRWINRFSDKIEECIELP